MVVGLVAVFLNQTVGGRCGRGGGGGGGTQIGGRGVDGAFVLDVVGVKRRYSQECVLSVRCKQCILPARIELEIDRYFCFVTIDSSVCMLN